MLERYVSRTTFTSYEDFKENFRIIVPENFSFGFDVVDEYARKEPNKQAIVWCNDSGGCATFTFADVARESNKIANFLKSIGIRKGDMVMLILKRRYEFWFALIALHKIGAVPIPATHMLTSKDIVYRCKAADIKMIIAADDERLLESVDEAQADSPTLEHKAVIRMKRDGWYSLEEEVADAPTEFPRPTGDDATSNKDMFLLYFTSGTTGMPKMVLHDYSYPLGHILTSKFWQNCDKDGVHLTVADTGWAKAAWGKIYGQWICGSAVFVYDYEGKFDPKSLLDVMKQYKVTTFCAPTTVYRFLAQVDSAKLDFSSLKYCVTAGEPLYPEVYSGVMKSTGLRLMEGYGQTECTLSIANYPWMEPRPGSMGKPSPGYDIEIVNDDGTPCDVGEEGQVVIRTDKYAPVGLFCGYYREPERTASVWHDDIYYTGDIAWRDEDGYFWYVGRADDVIKSSGYRIGPFEVESVLIEHPAVLECAVTGVPDDLRGQVVKATIVLSEGFTPSDGLAEELQNYVKNMTAPYKYPRIIEFIDTLPRTISGKVRRTEIREKDGAN